MINVSDDGKKCPKKFFVNILVVLLVPNPRKREGCLAVKMGLMQNESKVKG